MSYSFTQSRLSKWTAVKTKVIKAKVSDTQTITYHIAYLPVNSELGDLKSHIGQYSDVNGLVQQWWVIADTPEGEEENPLIPVGEHELPPLIWALADSECFEDYPIAEDLLVNNVGILRLASDDGIASDWPKVQGRAVFTMVPLPFGAAYSLNSNLEKGQFALVFMPKRGYDKPIELNVTLRHIVNVHNN